MLDLFDIGHGKPGRATEVIFVERCLRLLKPGATLAIVLPDGNLNNPGLGWLRRWCEGRARLRAVVSLPEETFRSSRATVKCSVVVMARFTAADDAAWEAAWVAAHGVEDGAFVARRDAALATVNALNPKIDGRWTCSEPPAYPRGIGATRLVKPGWGIFAKSAADAEGVVKADADAAWAACRAAIKRIDAEHDAALWAAVRERFDYPVFVAAPRAVGITSTGETGEGVANDLPAVLTAWRAFEAWCDAGG